MGNAMTTDEKLIIINNWVAEFEWSKRRNTICIIGWLQFSGKSPHKHYLTSDFGTTALINNAYICVINNVWKMVMECEESRSMSK